MKSARAASLSEPILYAPGTTFNLNVTFPVSYDLSGKWLRFVLKKSATGSTILRIDDDNGALSVSGQVASAAITPTTANDITGGLTLAELAKADSTLAFAFEFGDDGDTDIVEYRLQGDLKAVSNAGEFESTTSATGVTVNFEETDVTVSFAEKGEDGVVNTSTIGTVIAGAAAKNTPNDADCIGYSDSEASGVLKRIPFSNLKAWLYGLFYQKSETYTRTEVDNAVAGAGGGANAGDDTNIDGVVRGNGSRLEAATAEYLRAAAELGATDDAALRSLRLSASVDPNFEIRADEQNGAVDALFILPPGLSQRIFIGDASHTALLDFRHCISLSNLPSTNFTGVVIGGADTYSIHRENGSRWIEYNSSALGGHKFEIDSVSRLQILTEGLELTAGIKLAPATVDTLPTASLNSGFRYEVTDANTPTAGATVASGGSDLCEVRSDGTNWVVINTTLE